MKKRSMWARGLLKTVLALGFIYMLLRWFEHHQVYHPSREMIATGTELGRLWEDVFFRSGDGVELNGWFFPADTNSPRAGVMILVCHGNAGNISGGLDLYQALLETGVNVFAFDYRGYGRSAGRPGEEGTYRDAQAAHRWLRQKGFAGRNIIAYGESLGGGVASELCLREETSGLILQSTFTSMPDIGKEIYPWLPVRLISTIKYDTRGKLPRIKVPVLVMHSRTDDLIGFHHAEKNFATAGEPKFFCELPGAHNDPGWESPDFGRGVEQLLRALESRGL
jgi:fermentation-respiration switch protein FrsA (DUF1100 family)